MNPTDFRNTLNVLDSFLTEAPLNKQTLSIFKAEIAARIKELPADDASMLALKEIEDLLKHVNAGGRMGIINGELKSINDPTVDAAQKEIARYILSVPQTPEQREELFKLWKADKLVDRKKLLSVGKHSFADLISKYNSNPLIKELVNEFMHIAALGQGKGEFGLSVLSKSIHKQEGKGDLSIEGRPIEVKTTDGGAGRFTDQEVRPSQGFEQAARDLNKFVGQHPTTPMAIPKSGLSLNSAVSFYGMLADNKEKKKYLDMVTKVITIIFGGSKNKDIDDIINAVKSDNVGAAMQAYAIASFNYYMSKKKDEGVLYINVVSEPITTVFFKKAEDLVQSSLRLHAGTAYITAIADIRLPYPQIEIKDTTFGANAAAAQQKLVAKQAALDVKNDKLKAKLAGKMGGGMTDIRPPGTKTVPSIKSKAISSPREKRK
jgi:hypothetical protein